MSISRQSAHIMLGSLLGVAALSGSDRLAADGEATRMLRSPTISAAHVAFVYANNIWVVERGGGNARRLTSFQGQTINPKFSPDGATIAFSGDYGGNMDVYTVPAEGGEPTRLTWHPGADTVQGWTHDGKRVMFESAAARADQPQSPCADTHAVVERAGAYVKQLGQELGNVIATEDYRQELVGQIDLPKDAPPPIAIAPGVQVQPAAPLGNRTSLTQNLRSSFLFVQMPANQGWIGFRDVLEVNGTRLSVDARNRTQLEVAGESALDRWRRLSEESARYNLGSITRTANVPTFALLVLYPENQTRFSFTSSGEARGSGSSACDVAFQENGSPTIIRSSIGADVPSSGTFRIEPVSGRVVRTELMAGSTTTGVALKALVQYERDQKLQLWLPREMREEYITRSGERLHCVARYSTYRRAEISFTVRPG